uniref:Adhesion G protein-coupled receptor F7 n=1 Tax=Poecilia latipinna TaxID=48699 RepID=A0A3B3TX69_9TELE
MREVQFEATCCRANGLVPMCRTVFGSVAPDPTLDSSFAPTLQRMVALVSPEVEISNISLTFDVINYTNFTIGNPKCVFWDFNLYDGLGGWSDDGCSLVYFENETVSCNCNHTTSFSILMSPDSPRSLILDFITYIGVGISMACLVICLIIEAVIWRKINKNATSYLRHVSIVNIALSLLIANIWFIIGAAISDADQKNPPACTAATFFIHFFYLALFFWMLASALLLLYRTLSVFDGGLSKLAMLIIGFSLGYGAPLIIATITIASTAPSNQYIRENVVCWLNWYESKALLAFVIPALMIVGINFIILIVVLYKILRRRVGGNASQTGEKHVLYVIARSLAVLTPFFGLTWGLGIGTMVDPKNFGIHVAFAFFNSLQVIIITKFLNFDFTAIPFRCYTKDGTAVLYLLVCYSLSESVVLCLINVRVPQLLQNGLRVNAAVFTISMFAFSYLNIMEI